MDTVQQVAQVLAEHSIECTGIGEVTCRQLCSKNPERSPWMPWRTYHAHVAQALADAGLLAEHGDAQQVREQITEIVVRYTRDTMPDKIMAVVAPRLAARDAAVERALRFERERNHATVRAERAEADLAAARQQLDQAANRADELAKHAMALAVKLDQVREYARFVGSGNGPSHIPAEQVKLRLLAIIDAPARPAGHDETE